MNKLDYKKLDLSENIYRKDFFIAHSASGSMWIDVETETIEEIKAEIDAYLERHPRIANYTYDHKTPAFEIWHVTKIKTYDNGGRCVKKSENDYFVELYPIIG